MRNVHSSPPVFPFPEKWVELWNRTPMVFSPPLIFGYIFVVDKKGFCAEKIMEIFLDIPWICCLFHVASQSTYQLSIMNKHNVIVNDNMDNRQWIRCFKCFKSFHLSCLSKHNCQFFDDHIILRNSIDEPFLCKNCSTNHSRKCE